MAGDGLMMVTDGFHRLKRLMVEWLVAVAGRATRGLLNSNRRIIG